jgi:hypothetical protein
MGCFSFLCKKCGKPINSDSFRGQRAILYLLKNGEVIERMSGEYDSYGRVFNEKGESFHWNMPWKDVCKLMFDSDISNGICVIHEKCLKEGDIPIERSDDDENQGWGKFTFPKNPFIPAFKWAKSTT